MIPNGIDPLDLQPVDDLDDAARALRRARRAARAARRPARLREGLPARARRAARPDRAPRRRALPRRRLGHARGRSCAAQARELGLDRARHVPRLDRRRRAALALPDRRPLRGARASTSRSASSRSRRWRRGCPCIVADTGGLREVVPEDERRRPALQRAATPSPSAEMVERLLTDDALRDAARGRGLRARAALRLGRRRPPDGGRLRAARARQGLTAFRGVRLTRVVT